MRTGTALLALMLLLGQLSPPASATPGGSIVSFSVDSDGAVVVPVSIREQGPFRFVLDTGSSHSVLSESLAGRMGLQPVARSTIVTSAGDASVAVIRLESVAVGSVVAQHLLPSLVSDVRLDALAPGVDGVLGGDFLAARAFTIDYARKRLVWGTMEHLSSPRLNSVRVPLVTVNGRFVAVLRQHDDTDIALVPDTGSGAIVLYDNERSRRQALLRLSDDRTIELIGLAGSRPGRSVRLRELRIGTMVLRDQPATLVATSADEHRDVDGLLPLHTFSRVSFCPAEGYMAIEW